MPSNNLEIKFKDLRASSYGFGGLFRLLLESNSVETKRSVIKKLARAVVNLQKQKDIIISDASGSITNRDDLESFQRSCERYSPSSIIFELKEEATSALTKSGDVVNFQAICDILRNQLEVDPGSEISEEDFKSIEQLLNNIIDPRDIGVVLDGKLEQIFGVKGKEIEPKGIFVDGLDSDELESAQDCVERISEQVLSGRVFDNIPQDAKGEIGLRAARESGKTGGFVAQKLFGIGRSRAEADMSTAALLSKGETRYLKDQALKFNQLVERVDVSKDDAEDALDVLDTTRENKTNLVKQFLQNGQSQIMYKNASEAETKQAAQDALKNTRDHIIGYHLNKYQTKSKDYRDTKEKVDNFALIAGLTIVGLPICAVAAIISRVIKSSIKKLDEDICQKLSEESQITGTMYDKINKIDSAVQTRLHEDAKDFDKLSSNALKVISMNKPDHLRQSVISKVAHNPTKDVVKDAYSRMNPVALGA